MGKGGNSAEENEENAERRIFAGASMANSSPPVFVDFYVAGDTFRARSVQSQQPFAQ